MPDPQVECLELALHEVLANVLDHGGSAARAEPIRIRIEVREKARTGEAHVKVRDADVLLALRRQVLGALVTRQCVADQYVHEFGLR